MVGMMSPTVVNQYIKAGKIIRSVRESIPSFVKEGTSFSTICEHVEGAIRRKGGEPAFPCNIGVNDVAAHYTASPNDAHAIPAYSVVKVDLGAHINGHIADTAITVTLNPEDDPLRIAATEAVDQAIKHIAPGIQIQEISRIIQRTIESHGYQPIRNLTGHGLKPYLVHTPPSIPNVTSPRVMGRFKANHVYAIEPFVTSPDADGQVINGPPGNIYHITTLKHPKNKRSRKLLREIYATYRTLPFTTRWVSPQDVSSQIHPDFTALIREKRVKAYPVLCEKTGQSIAQTEHSVLLTEHETILLT
jgi:methionyl aminopeptidase